ncbi:amidohydrolase family protein [Mycetocola lacteus]|uniref:amidohydrolase family protein n=1 Tax=Mycetocola lacteus TaxID=76637 RepID=UPI001C7E158B|nr:amidohydrolase family protein [Mycetocola lacteus]
MTTALLITNVRPWGAETTDVLLSGGVIVAVGAEVATHPEAPTAEILDGEDRLLVPSFSDTHVHLDSTRLGLPFRPYSGEPGRDGRIYNDRANWRSAEKSVTERATYTLERMIAHGATRVRSHAQVDADSGLEKFAGVLAAREAYADRADVEIVVFPQVGIHREPGVPELMSEALRSGGNLVGGIDPCEIDRDPVRHLNTVFELAERHGAGADIHLHEAGLLGLFSMDLIFERVRALSMQGQVSISHAPALGSGLPQVDKALEQIAELDIAITHIAPSGGGWVLPLERMSATGIRVGLGMDGQRDYWSPYGNADMLDRTWQLAFVQNYNRDDQIENALELATWGGARVINRELSAAGTGRPGVAVGDPAELVLIPGETPTSAVMDRPALGRVVIHAGRVVARDGELC